MKKVIILNGPPNSGKDVGARFLVDHLREHWVTAVTAEFKSKLFELVMAVWSIDQTTWDALYTRELKEEPSDLLDGLSPRQALIQLSEDVIKPAYGKNYFGQAAAKGLINGVNVFSDGGFVEELQPIIDMVGSENVLVLRITRPGCSFAGDSRTYLPANIVPFSANVSNDSTEEAYFHQLTGFVTAWQRQLKMNAF